MGRTHVITMDLLKGRKRVKVRKTRYVNQTRRLKDAFGRWREGDRSQGGLKELEKREKKYLSYVSRRNAALLPP